MTIRTFYKGPTVFVLNLDPKVDYENHDLNATVARYPQRVEKDGEVAGMTEVRKVLPGVITFFPKQELEVPDRVADLGPFQAEVTAGRMRILPAKEEAPPPPPTESPRRRNPPMTTTEK